MSDRDHNTYWLASALKGIKAFAVTLMIGLQE